MVRLSKKEQHDKLQLLSSITQMNIVESKQVDNGEFFIFSKQFLLTKLLSNISVNAEKYVFYKSFTFP